MNAIRSTRQPLLAVLLMLVSLLPAPTARAQFDDFGGPGGGFGAQSPVTLSIHSSRAQARPGDQVILAIRADISDAVDDQGKHWHIYPPEGVHDGIEIASTIVPSIPDAFTVGQVQWPEPIIIKNWDNKDQPVYEGIVYFYLPLIVDTDAKPGRQTLKVDFGYQACNSSCIAPTVETLTVDIEIVPIDAPATDDASTGRAFAQFDPTAWATIGETQTPDVSAGDEAAQAAGDAKPRTITLAGIEFDPNAGAGLAILLGFAVLGGALLNFTPCVLPVIPIKIMGLSQSAGGRQRTVLLGVVMFAGVLSFWLAIAAALVFFKGFSAPSQLFATWWFSVAVGVLILVMGAGMLGAWNTKLPQWVYRINPKHDSIHGAFGFGVMTAVLALPCTGPFLGTAIGWATTTGSAMVMLVFGALGAGMGMPYLVLLLFPKLVDKMPRAGAGSELLKQVLGVFMLAAALYFLTVGAIAYLRGIVPETVPPAQPPDRAAALIEGGQRLIDSFSAVMWWPIFLITAAAGAWLILRVWQIAGSTRSRVVFTAVGGLLVFASLSLAVALGQPVKRGEHIDWVYYTPESFTQSFDEDSIVVVDFTADWCLNCKWLEANVLETQEVRDLLNSDQVVPVKVDLTALQNNPGWKFLAEVGRSSIPQLVVYKPGGEIAWISEWYGAEDVIEAVNAARAKPVASNE